MKGMNTRRGSSELYGAFRLYGSERRSPGRQDDGKIWTVT